MKSYADFLESLNLWEPEFGWSPELKALWWDAKGDWEKSHNIAQDINGSIGDWIHGYLHRKEGDEWNASYWYHRANRHFKSNTLDEEQRELVEHILGLN
jgi:hypothetical protein